MSRVTRRILVGASCLVFMLQLALPGAGVVQAQPPDTSNAAVAPAVEGRPFFWALSVRDIETSSSWYQRVLGFSEVRRIDMPERGARIRLLRTEHAFLELVEHATARYRSEVDSDLSKAYQVHGAFKIGLLVEDLSTALDRLGSLEVPLCGSVFTEPDNSFRSAQIEDPDGNILQLFESLGEK